MDSWLGLSQKKNHRFDKYRRTSEYIRQNMCKALAQIINTMNKIV